MPRDKAQVPNVVLPTSNNPTVDDLQAALQWVKKALNLLLSWAPDVQCGTSPQNYSRHVEKKLIGYMVDLIVSKALFRGGEAPC